MGYFDDLKPKPPPLAPLRVVEPARGTATSYAAAALRKEAQEVAATAEGGRNHALNRAYFRMGRHVGAGNIDADTVKQALAEAGRACGLPQDEIDTVLRDDPKSGLAKGLENPRHPAPLPELPALAPIDVPDLDPTDEDDFWHARTILLHLHTFARARRVSPWAVLGVTLARVVTATPHQVHIPPIIGGKASLNLFIGLVGPSGSGKGAAEAVAADALHVGPIVSHNVGSGEGIAHGYKHREKRDLVWNDTEHAVLFSVPEIDSLAAQGDRRGATLMPQLRSGWTGEQLGFGYADPTKRIIVEKHEYRLCLVAGIQPGRAGCLLDDADGGTPQRFLWLPATDIDAPDVAPLEPTHITWKKPPVSSIVSIGGSPIKVCQAAQDTIRRASVERLRGKVGALDGHALLARLKGAAALALLESRLEVTDEDWDLAGVVMQKSNATRAAVVETLRSKSRELNEAKGAAEAHRAVQVDDAKEEAAVKRACSNLLRRLRRESDWLPRGKLRADALMAKDRGNFDVAISRLIEAGQVLVEEGSKGVRYRCSE